MRNSKLYKTLKTFDRYEQNRFRKFLQSPFFNRDENLERLYDLFCTDINKNANRDPEKRKGDLTKTWLWEKMDLNIPFNDVRWRKYISDLLKLTVDYLAYENFERKPMEQAKNVMEAVGWRKIKPLFGYAIKMGAKATKTSKNESPKHYLKKYQLELNNYLLGQHELQRSEKSNLEAISENLDIFYLSEKLRLASVALTQEGIMKVSYDMGLKDEVVSGASKKRYQEFPAIAINQMMLKTISHPEDDGSYFELKRLLLQHQADFPKSEVWDAYKYALNYCGRKIKLGQPSFTQEFFEIFTNSQENEIFLADGELSPWLFKNVITIALRLKRYEWAKTFVNNYSSHLPDSFRANAVTFNLAKIAFYQKDYEEVIDLLRYVEYDDYSYNLNSKMFLTTTYYETDEIELIYSTVDSFQTYLRRHKKNLAKNTQEHYLNFTKLISRLVKVDRHNKDKIARFERDLNETKNTAARNWFHEKIAELRGQKSGTPG